MRDGATALRPIAPLSSSSGDLIADRRFEWARDAREKGDLAAAADLLAQTVELAPGHAAAWFALGEVKAAQGDKPAAIEAFTRARTADPADRLGAALQLARLGAPPPEPMPPAYVRAVFDEYAPRFDRALIEGLDYRAPQLLLAAVQATAEPMKFGSALDLGCGTGLGGAAFRPFCNWLVGVDLSPGMLREAGGKGLYDRLAEADAVAFLRGEAQAGARYHLVLAADVFMYLPKLGTALLAAAAVMAPGAPFAFTVESHDGAGVLLRDTLRYAHGADHVRTAISSAGLDIVRLDSAATRTEKGVAVPGLLAVARKPEG